MLDTVNFTLSPFMIPLFEKVIKEMMSEEKDGCKNELIYFKKKLTETEKTIKECRIRYGTGEIDKETFDITIQTLQEKRGNLLLSIEDCQRDLSNSETKYILRYN